MDKKRRILQAVSPIPAVSGKGVIEMKGEQSKNVVSSNLPEFYLRLAKEERFGIMRLKVDKGLRIVERISVVPVTKEIIEEQDQVEVFRRQLGDGLYEDWPMKPLEPGGNITIYEFTPAEFNAVSLQTWDFSVRK